MPQIECFGILIEQKPKRDKDYPCQGCYFAHWQACSPARAKEEGRPCDDCIWEAVDDA